MPTRFRRIIHQQAQVSSFETFYSNPESLTTVMLSKFTKLLLGNTLAIQPCSYEAASKPLLPKVVTGWCKLKVRARVGTLIKHFLAMIFISVLLGLIDFSDTAMLHSRTNSCCQQNLKRFDVPLLSLGLFLFS